MKTTRKRFIVLLVPTLVSALGVLAQTPPNDSFDNRTMVTGSTVTLAGSLAGATVESGESDPGTNSASGGSVWWSWTAPTSSTVVILMTTVSPNRVGVWTGTSLNSLALRTYSSSPKPAGRYLRFDAVAGVAYQVQVIGTDNQPFSLQLIATNPPVFVLQPNDCTVSPFGSAFFSALATGPAPSPGYPPKPTTSYQWFFNGVPILGQTFPSLLVHGVTTNQAGNYSIIASNVGGVTQGGAALLTIADTNPVPGLAALPPTNSASLRFTLKGEPGRWYKIQSSTNLHDWMNPSRLLLTNPTVSISVQRLAPAHYVRAFLDVPTEVCVGQLKQMDWAKNAWAIENNEPATAVCLLENVKPYVPLWSGVALSSCPAGGTYATVFAVTNYPTCTIVGHLIPQQH